jgi:hypothetical protein
MKKLWDINIQTWGFPYKQNETLFLGAVGVSVLSCQERSPEGLTPKFLLLSPFISFYLLLSPFISSYLLLYLFISLFISTYPLLSLSVDPIGRTLFSLLLFSLTVEPYGRSTTNSEYLPLLGVNVQLKRWPLTWSTSFLVSLEPSVLLYTLPFSYKISHFCGVINWEVGGVVTIGHLSLVNLPSLGLVTMPPFST